MSGVRAARAAPLRLVLFDLDGTLVDSAPDIATSVNLLMVRNSLPTHSLVAVRGMIGDGIETLVRRAFAANGVALEADALRSRHEEMLAIYGSNLTKLTTLREGATEAVRASRRAGLATGVVTNKSEGFSRSILEAFALLDDMDLVIGGDSGFRRKPAPDMLLEACRRTGCPPGAATLVGDSPADFSAGRAAGVTCVLVRGGYSAAPVDTLGADHVIAEPGDFVSLLPALVSPA